MIYMWKAGGSLSKQGQRPDSLPLKGQVTKDNCKIDYSWSVTYWAAPSFGLLTLYKTLWQGGNEVCFFIADPFFARKFLILDSKSVTNFRPWSHKYGTAWSLIPKKL